MGTTWEKILKRLKAPGSTLRNSRAVFYRGISHIKNDFRRYEGEKKGNLLKVFWWQDYPNFGDDLNRVLSIKFGFTPVKAAANEAELVLIGSVLDMVPECFSGSILGSGFRSDGPKRSLSDARILALRGYLTADRLSISSGLPVLGDPGLLVSRFAQRRTPRYDIGIVPHFTDLESSSFRMLERRFGKRCKIIDPRQSGSKVVNKISECGSIFSSSLHGLVTADALGIPSRWIHFSEKEIPAFKFHDYYSAYNETREPIKIDGNESLNALVGLALTPPALVKEVTLGLGKQVDDYFNALKETKFV